MSLMGVDVGTTGVKAVAFDENGKLLSSAYEEYPLQFPFPGAVELDSQRVLDAAFRVISKAASDVKMSDPVVCIGIASQGEAYTPVTSDGRMLGNVMTSSDTRAEPFVRPWGEEFGWERLYRITGHTPYPMYSLFKLLWLKEHSPEVWSQTWKFLFCQDLLAFALTGETKTDYTMAARSMLFDVNAMEWSAEILHLLDLSPEHLPEALPSGTVVGMVRPSIAESLGLQPNVKVSVCGHDQPVGALGCGAAVPGSASYCIGTVECICAAVGRLILGKGLMSGNLATYPHVLPDLYTTVAFNMTGGSVLRWVRDHFATLEAAEARETGEDPYDRIISAASPEPSRVIVLPHFGPTGTPHFDPLGVGVVFGLTLSTDRSEVLRAFLDGITYEMRWNLSILADAGFELKELRTIGGGSRSDTWMQIKADILGLPLITMQAPESTCMGAALLAGGGADLLVPQDAVASWAVPIKTFLPSKDHASLYAGRFAVYQRIYESLADARGLLHTL